MKNLFNYLMVLSAMIIVTSCQREMDSILDAEQVSIASQLEKDKAYIAELGFDVSTLVDKGDVYVVEGDILLEKKSLYDYSEFAEGVVTRQAYYSGGLVSRNKVQNISVGMDSSVSGDSGWSDAVLSALQEWNNIYGCLVNFKYTTSLNPDIMIKRGSFADTQIVAEASWPKGGNPGNIIQINFGYSHYSASQKLFIMVHELGHCLGLRHTNWQALGESSGTHIEGTPSTDSQSVMNGVTAGTNWSGFSSSDVYAIRYMYPFYEIFFKSIREINNGSSIKVEAILEIPGQVELTMQVGLHIASSSENPEVVFNSGTGGSIVVNKTNVSNPSAATKTFLYSKGTYNVSLSLQGINSNSNTQAAVSIIGVKSANMPIFKVVNPSGLSVNSL